jgi:hypothetical protein
MIRWADVILVLEGGELVAHGNHERLLCTSRVYRRIFARYDIELPPLEAEPSLAAEQGPVATHAAATPPAGAQAAKHPPSESRSS